MNTHAQNLISDAMITHVHANAQFGSITPRQVVNEAVLKYAFGYSTGHTAMVILQEHRLLTRPRPGRSPQLTALGMRYLRAVYGEHFSAMAAFAGVPDDRPKPAYHKASWEAGRQAVVDIALDRFHQAKRSDMAQAEYRADEASVIVIRGRELNPPATLWEPTHHHIKRGSSYREVARGKVQTDTPLADYAEVVVYQAEDQTTWIRSVSEFEDGRFKVLGDHE